MTSVSRAPVPVLLTQANIRIDGAAAGDFVGGVSQGVAGLGDVNGDGRADVLISASAPAAR
jgi:hypothetical protein